MSYSMRPLTAALAVGLLFASTLGADSLELIDRLYSEGPGRAVEVRDELAFLGAGSTLVVVDVADPLRPRAIGRLETPGRVVDLALAGDLVLVADWAGGLRVVDAATPEAPREIASFDTGEIYTAVAWRNGFAYLATAHLRIVDLRDPERPSEAAFVEENLNDLFVRGGLLYALRPSELRIYDVSTPAAPVLLGTTSVRREAQRVVAGGDGLAFVGHDEGFEVLDVADPAAPRRLGEYRSPWWAARDFEVRGRRLYVAAQQWAGVEIFDLADPASPRRLGGSGSHGDTDAVAVAGRLAFAATEGSGLRVLDVGDPRRPVELGVYPTPAFANRLDLAGRTVLLNTWTLGLEVVRLGRGGVLRRVGGLETPDRGIDVFRRGGLAYLADLAGGLRVVEVRDPRRPRLVAEVPQLSARGGLRAREVHVEGGIAYVIEERGALVAVYDVADPRRPTRLAAYDTPGRASDVFVHRGLALVAEIDGGLTVLDAADPGALVHLSTIEAPPGANRVFARGRRAYVVGWSQTLVIDLDQPAEPRVLATLDAGGSSLHAAAGRIFVGSWDGIRVFDETAGSAVETVFFPTPAPVSDLRLRSGTLFAAAGDAGLYALRWRR